mgnify:CR=1 FL=1
MKIYTKLAELVGTKDWVFVVPPVDSSTRKKSIFTRVDFDLRTKENCACDPSQVCSARSENRLCCIEFFNDNTKGRIY